jgi:hypothetical protein
MGERKIRVKELRLFVLEQNVMKQEELITTWTSRTTRRSWKLAVFSFLEDELIKVLG